MRSQLGSLKVGILVVLVTTGAVALLAEQDALDREEALELGRRMYAEGILASGEPMQATVQGDIDVDGTMFSCQSCHLNSGIGSNEGTVITLPINGAWLSQPLVGARMSRTSRDRLPPEFSRDEYRPAYTDRTLARAIRVGKDPNGRVFHAAMPRYAIGTSDMELMISYLRNLCAEWSPGITETTMRFATVVGEGVDEADRDAMLLTLDAYIRDRNSQVRHEEERAKRGPWYKEEKFKPYRRISLERWDVTGAPDTWREQLEKHYRNEPVFALIGGIVTGEWAPVHEFCEENRIPCLFPVTDFPVISDSDWYTVYFSKGPYQEGDTAVRFLRRSKKVARDAPVLQVYRDGPEERALSRGFQETRLKLRLPRAESRVLAPGEEITPEMWSDLTSNLEAGVLVLWMGAADLAKVSELIGASSPPGVVVISAGLLDEDLGSLPESMRPYTYITYPHAPEEDKQQIKRATRRWLEVKKVPITNVEIQEKMYALGWLLTGPIKMMRDDFYRDYFLDSLDMMRDQDYAIPTYTRLSFGPGQRYASKGCYIVQLGEGPESKVVKQSDWVIH